MGAEDNHFEYVLENCFVLLLLLLCFWFICRNTLLYLPVFAESSLNGKAGARNRIKSSALNTSAVISLCGCSDGCCDCGHMSLADCAACFATMLLVKC